MEVGLEPLKIELRVWRLFPFFKVLGCLAQDFYSEVDSSVVISNGSLSFFGKDSLMTSVCIESFGIWAFCISKICERFIFNLVLSNFYFFSVK